MKRAARMDGIAGFGIDRVAAAVLDADVLRLENLDTDLALPPEAVDGHAGGAGGPGLELVAAVHGRPRAAGGDLRRTSRRATGASTTRSARSSSPAAGPRACSTCCWPRVDPGDEVVLTDPTYAGLVNRVRLAGGVPVCAPLAVVDGEWRLDRDALAAAVSERTVALLHDEPVDADRAACSTREDWAAVATMCVERDLFLIYDAAMEALLFDGRAPLSPLDDPGMAGAHGDRRLDVQGLPDDRLARGLGRRAGRAGERRRLGAHLQHDRQRLRRAARGRGGPARAAGARGRGGGGAASAAATRSSPRCPAGRSCAPRAAGRCCSTSAALGSLARAGVGGDARGGRRGHGDERVGRGRRGALRALRVQRRAGRAAGDARRAAGATALAPG